MIEIRVFYFGWITDVTRCKEEQKCTSVQTVYELLEELTQAYPSLGDRQKYRVSVNRKLIIENVELSTGDEIALLPPFSGG
jgi:molybdopterin converting factor small subunit